MSMRPGPLVEETDVEVTGSRKGDGGKSIDRAVNYPPTFVLLGCD